jgi:hypothetical protein
MIAVLLNHKSITLVKTTKLYHNYNEVELEVGARLILGWIEVTDKL